METRPLSRVSSGCGCGFTRIARFTCLQEKSDRDHSNLDIFLCTLKLAYFPSYTGRFHTSISLNTYSFSMLNPFSILASRSSHDIEMVVDNGTHPNDQRCPSGLETEVILKCNKSAKWTNLNVTEYLLLVLHHIDDPCKVGHEYIFIYEGPFSWGV